MHIGKSDQGVCRASLSLNSDEFAAELESPHRDDDDPLLRETAAQLRAYFDGKLRDFDVPLDLGGTLFQQRVWNELLTIPYGEIRTYAQMAAAIGAPKAVRAVGSANGQNRVPVIVPCHRVIQTGGGLGGYTGGLHFKRMLLTVEGRADVLPKSNGSLF